MKRYRKLFDTYQPMRILLVGDSTTSMEWIHPNWSDWLSFTFKQGPEWPNGLGRQVINVGRAGGTIQHYLSHFAQMVGMYQPDVVVMSLGLNHLGQTEEYLEGQLASLMGKIVGSGADLVTWSPYATPDKERAVSLRQVSWLYKRLTAQYDGTFVNVYHEFIKYDLDRLFTLSSPWENTDWGIRPGDRDTIHTNELGNQLLAQTIVRKAFGVDLLEWSDYGTMKLGDLEKVKR